MKKWPGEIFHPGKMTLAMPRRSDTDHSLLIQFPPTKLILLAGGSATKHNGQHPVGPSPNGIHWTLIYAERFAPGTQINSCEIFPFNGNHRGLIDYRYGSIGDSGRARSG